MTKILNECLALAYENLQLSKKRKKVFKGDGFSDVMIEMDKKSIALIEKLKTKYAVR